MRCLITLKPLEPFLFGGKHTFGTLGDKEQGSYIVHSEQFPQQTALLGMLRHEFLVQGGYLTRKRRGEWIDGYFKDEATKLVGKSKFDMLATKSIDLGAIQSISPVFLIRDGQRYIPKANTEDYPYEMTDQGHPRLGGDYTTKEEDKLHDHFISLDGGSLLTSEQIFRQFKQVGNQKTARPTYTYEEEEVSPRSEEDDAYFKRLPYTLAKGFEFGFYLEYDESQITLPDHTIVTLGADRGAFAMRKRTCGEEAKTLSLSAKNTDELILLSDSYIPVPLKECAEFAITSEREIRYVKRDGSRFQKSEAYYLYERGSVFVRPSQDLITALNNPNLQKIGFNHYIYTQGEHA